MQHSFVRSRQMRTIVTSLAELTHLEVDLQPLFLFAVPWTLQQSHDSLVTSTLEWFQCVT
eukprot:4035797-Amphidinium_carterae.2